MDRQSLWNRLRRDAIVGLAFVLPLVLLLVALYGVSLFIVRAFSWSGTALNLLGIEGQTATAVAILAIAAAVPGVLVGLGMGLRHRYGGRIGDGIDAVLLRIPGVGPLYASLRQSRQAVLETRSGFSEVVSLELGDGVDVLAFVVGRSAGADWTPGDQRVTVFVPLSPNPTLGGHLLAVHPERVTETSLGVREALTVLVTVGTGDPEPRDPAVAGLYREFTESRRSEERASGR